LERQDGDFQGRQRPARVAVGHRGPEVQGVGIDFRIDKSAEAALAIGDGPANQNPRISSSLSGANWKIWLRLTSGELTAKNGFSVVAPTSSINPGFDIGEQNVLLRAVEAVNFIEEQNRAAAAIGQPILGRDREWPALP
jgi:hypothetical protein